MEASDFENAPSKEDISRLNKPWQILYSNFDSHEKKPAQGYT